MRRRLILSTALIALTAVVVLGVPLALVEAARLRQDSTGRLEREADAVASAIDDRVERRQPVTPARLRRTIPASHRITVETSGDRRVVSGPPIGGEVLRARAGAGLGLSVVAEAPIGELEARVHRAWLLIAALSLAGVLTAVALAALQARRLARPLEAIARRSEQLGDGDFSMRAGHYGVPEIDAIAQGLDSSAGRIAELVAREREFSANVSHQLRTPLTALRLRLEQAGDDDDPQARAREIEAALRETDRLEATIADLLALAREASAGATATVNAGSVAHDHAERWRPAFADARRELEVAATRTCSCGHRVAPRARSWMCFSRTRSDTGAVRCASPSSPTGASHGSRWPTAATASRLRIATASSSEARRSPAAPASACTSRARWPRRTTAD